MKTYILILLFFASIQVSFGQTFISKHHRKLEKYNCSLKINNDSSILFIYHKNFNGIYGEYIGQIARLKDTVYRISATMTIGQFYMKPYDKDTLYIHLDSSIAKLLNKIQVEYADGITRKQLQGYSSLGDPMTLLKMPINKKLFNQKRGTNFITITINRKHFLSDSLLSCRIPFGSAASFTSGQKLEFDVIIKDNKLLTIGQPPLQTGAFVLYKK